ncbi:MAG: SWIM zinc finger family protein, partial [Acidobacteria bacterium]|nr:SWIM zinc finger family protein [Acidobacteriota bacterium]
SHVVHFDRWWNPAVENQATDRAFRIGQTKNVLVHKFLCRGTVEEKIDRLIELLQGRFSKGVMERICQEKAGLFPSPSEITFTCSCPDWASMCKHVAAVLYGIGARLDEKPDLLFALRNVNHQELIAKAGKGLSGARKSPSAAKVLDTGDLSEIFGIELAEDAKPRPGRKRRPSQ